MKRSSSRYLTIFLVAVLTATIVFSLHSGGMGGLRVRAYVVPMGTGLQENSLSAINLANMLLNVGAKVYWTSEPTVVATLNGSEYPLDEGSFIIPIYRNTVKYGFQSSISPFLEELSNELNVTTLRIFDLPQVTVYTLKRNKIAIYYGGGAGAMLWQIDPLEKAGFNLDIIVQADICRGDLDGYDVVLFPGGGPYLRYLKAAEIDEIKRFVEEGGGFLGTCGGMAFGVQIGLLNAQLAYSMIEPTEHHVNIRGPIILESTSSCHPTTFGLSKLFRCDYVLGPFLDEVEEDVTVVATYHASTPDLYLYYAEVFKAYNYTIETDLSYLDDYLGTPAIIAGEYGNGKVVLFSTHPENLPESQLMFINSIYFLLSKERVSLESVFNNEDAGVLTFEESSFIEWNETQYSCSSQLMHEINVCSSNLKDTLDRLDKEKNRFMVGLTAEYLEEFVLDIHLRSLITQEALPMLDDANRKLEELKRSLPTLPIYENTLMQIRKMQSMTSSILDSISKLEDLIHLLNWADNELSKITEMLDHISSTALPESEYYQEVINLHMEEGAVTAILKNEISIHLLPLSFEVADTLRNVDFLLSSP